MRNERILDAPQLPELCIYRVIFGNIYVDLNVIINILDRINRRKALITLASGLFSCYHEPKAALAH